MDKTNTSIKCLNGSPNVLYVWETLVWEHRVSPLPGMSNFWESLSGGISEGSCYLQPLHVGQTHVHDKSAEC